MTTPDFIFFLLGKVVSAKPHIFGRSNTNPVLPGGDGTGQVLNPGSGPTTCTQAEMLVALRAEVQHPKVLFLNPRLTPERCGCRGVKQHLPLNISFGMRRLS